MRIILGILGVAVTVAGSIVIGDALRPQIEIAAKTAIPVGSPVDVGIKAGIGAGFSLIILPPLAKLVPGLK